MYVPILYYWLTINILGTGNQVMNDMFDVVTVRVDDHNFLAGTHDSEHQLDNFQFDYRINNTAKTDDVLQHIHQLASMIELEVI